MYQPLHIESLESRKLFAAGELDPTFGQGGAFAQRVDGRDIIRWIHEAPDGKIITAITTSYGSNGKLHIRRLNADGSPDLTFGGGDGDVLTTGPQHAEFFAMAPDGRIAISEFDTILVLNADGSPDIRFGTEGRFDPSAAIGSGAGRIIPAWTSDNKLVFAASLSLSASAVIRLNADGSIDTTFGGGDGVANSAIDATVQGTGIGLTGDGMVLVPASKFTSVENPDPGFPAFFYDRDVYLLRFDENGNELSPHVMFQGREQDEPFYVSFDTAPDGSVVAASLKPGPHGSRSVYLERFSAAGVQTQNILLARQLNASATIHVGVGDDGKPVVIAGIPEEAVYLQRYTVNGELDRSYGPGGIVRTIMPAPPDGFFRIFADVTHDGDAIIGVKRTRQIAGTAHEFVFSRYDGGDRTPYANLNANGTLTVLMGEEDDDVRLVIRSTDGRLVVRRNNDFAQSFAPSRVKRINIWTYGGNDKITIGPGVRGAYVDAGAGNDTLNGSSDTDVLIGGTGRDKIFGFDGDDILIGAGGNDYLLGGAGKDDLFGEAGIDTLSGAGGNDRLFGGSDRDFNYGGAGTDSASDDDNDEYDSIETILA